MHALLALVPALPLAGFAVLFVSAGALPKRWIAAIGVGSVGLSTLLAFIVAAGYLADPRAYTEVVWRWIGIRGFQPDIGFYLE